MKGISSNGAAMQTPLQILNDIQIASPCPAYWGSMAGDDFVRHCPECDKNVYNLSKLTAQAAADLIREKEGNLCVRLFRRKDGTVLTADCPVGLRQRTRRAFMRAGALVATILPFGLFSPCGHERIRESCASLTVPIRKTSKSTRTKKSL
jgi:hypothetical protein